jgi:virginiamycin A acetyltransferase
VYHPGTSLGRYSYIADTVRTFTRNHPMNIRSTHGLFYNPALGRVKGAPLQFGRLTIGHGVWIGHNATLLPPSREIGHGAVIAPGSVVSADVPAYALVSGFPARVTGYRFAKERIEELLTSRWWEKGPGELETGGGGTGGSGGRLNS